MRIWKLVSCFGVVVWIDETAEHVEAVQLVVHIESSSVRIIAETVDIILLMSASVKKSIEE